MAFSAKEIMEMEETVEESIDLLFNGAYSQICELSCTAYVTKEPLPFERRTEGAKKELSLNDKWAEEVFDCAWFHVMGEVPGADENTVFLINCGGEGLIYDVNGAEKQAITCVESDFSRELGMPTKRVVFTDGLIFDGRVDFWIDCAANDLFGKMKNDSRVSELHAARMNKEIRGLAYDVQVLYSVYEFGLDEDFKERLFEILAPVCKELEDGIDEAKAAELRERLAPLLAEKNEGETFSYTAIGHAHLDLAWLWPIRESYRKGARTFATQILNIKKYPGYIFGASQAQLYVWMKEMYPALYAKVKELVREGKSWELQGATWVEMDSNLISGESLVRQFFYGKQFYLEEFSQEMKILWVPDSFGYSACIPQVAKLANVPYFLTQKMSWNTVNKFPYHSFYWRGLDGSEILAHMLPEDTYNAPVKATHLSGGEDNYMERAISDKAMSLFGIGDGGAGPGFEHLERLSRYADLKGIPRVKPGMALDFFKEFDDGMTPYPTHSGELYLERHQGTYTTWSKIKKFNRKCEIALQNYEKLAALAINCSISLPISKERLDELWKEVLLYQFHDILPGSSINRVYAEAGARYDVIYAELTAAINALANYLVTEKSLVNLNPFSYNKNYSPDDCNWYNFDIPALGCVSVSEATPLTEFFAKADENSIENDRLRVTFTDGLITSLFDKTLQKEFVADGGKMALVSQYTDVGDCWDIRPEEYYDTKRDAVCTYFDTWELDAVAYAVAVYELNGTIITQEFSLTDGESLLKVDMEINCRQEDAMLRIAFPTSIETDECNFNIQFGHIARKTTENDSVEKAQYEVSGQKFVDMSEADFGLSFINDCKYGYRCKGGVIDLDLIRSPKGGPGTKVDQGEHTLTYALYTHAGPLGIDTYKEAYLLNNPLLLAGEGNSSGTVNTDGFVGGLRLAELYANENQNIVLETLKIPEDGNGLIARFYNAGAEKQETKAELMGYRAAEVMDIMENKISDKTDGSLSLRGFELINIRYVKAR